MKLQILVKMMTVFLVAFLAFVIVDAEESIQILPGPQLQKAKGENFAITCIVRANNNNLITNFQWLDTTDRVIDDAYLKQNRRYTIQKLGPEKQLLIINKLTDNDVGTFKCQINYDTRTIKAQIVVRTFQPITWIDAPTDQWALLGSKYKIKCKVEADPSPQVEWSRNNVKLDNDVRFTYETDGLVIQQVLESDDGDYSCQVVVSDTGEYERRDIHLEVVSKPTIVAKSLPVQHDVIEGEPTSIQCAAEGKPKPSISWIKTITGQNLTTGYDGILYVEKITKEDNGDFKCVAVNKAGFDERTVKFNVQSKPEVIESANATIAVGQSGQIQCWVYGNPTPNVEIRKQGFVVSRRVRRRRRNIESNEIPSETRVIPDPKGRRDVVQATLSFNRVERHMDGLYECVATNKIGDRVNQVIRNLHLTVEFKPSFEHTGVVNKVITWKQRPVNLTCIAEAIPNATITWYFANRREPLMPDPPSVYSFYGTGWNSILQVTPAKADYYGVYKCLAKNTLGEAVHEIALQEAFAPSPVSDITALDITATTITFRFSDPPSNGMPIRGYFVQYMEEGASDGWNNALNHTWLIGDRYILTGLRPLRSYSFRFAAINEVGFSEFSGYITKQMPEISVPSEPLISNPVPIDAGIRYIESPYANKIELRWVIPAANGAPIEIYSIKVCPALEDAGRVEGYVVPHYDSCDNKEVGYNEAVSSYIIDNLRPETFYLVQITATNSQGSGPTSSRLFKTNDVDEISTTGNGPMVKPHTETSSAVIIYAVIAILAIILFIVDIFCFFVSKTGIIYSIYATCCRRKKKNAVKLGSESKDLISNGHNRKIDIAEQTPMLVDGSKKETAVEYDPKKGTAKTAFAGKDSAV